MKKQHTQIQKQKVVVGVDVSKDTLDLCLLPMNQSRQFANSPEGIDQCVAFLQDFEPEIILCEATGGYEWTFLCGMDHAGTCRPGIWCFRTEGKEFMAVDQGSVAAPSR